jgi:hypothetical protein
LFVVDEGLNIGTGELSGKYKKEQSKTVYQSDRNPYSTVVPRVYGTTSPNQFGGIIPRFLVPIGCPFG